jgi:AcrR family transcriptional regulator
MLMAGRKRDPALDEAILRAASAVLAESGYANFAIETVAARLEIPKSTIYTRWRSRQQLLSHVLSRRIALMHDIDAHAAGDLRQTLVDHLTEDIRLSRTREGRAIAQATLAARDTADSHLDEIVQQADRRRAGYRLLLERAVEHGDLPAEADLDLVLDLLLGAVWAAVLRAHPRDEADASRLVDAVLAALPTRGSG